MKMFMQVVGVLGVSAVSVLAQSISNPSFEADSFAGWPGYVSGNTAITGWTASPTNFVGLNPAAGNPFANNGAVPNGTNVAFVQSLGNQLSTLSNNITGLVAGNRYLVRCRANSRIYQGDCAATWSVNGGSFVALTANPAVGASNPYYTNSIVFTATAATAPLVIANQTTNDSALLVDDFSVTLLTVTNTGDVVEGSLRRVIAAATVLGGNQTVTFAAKRSAATGWACKREASNEVTK